MFNLSFKFNLLKAASQQLYLRTSPAMRVFGKWRFLTYDCLIMQFAAYSLCLAAHYYPSLRRTRDYFFTSVAFPLGMTVVISFWSIWLIFGREDIFPQSIEQYYPPWLNHVTHTIIAPINLIQLISVRHNYNTDRRALIPLAAIAGSYTSFLLYIRFRTGRFVYNFLNKLDAFGVGFFLAGTAVFLCAMYKTGKIIHDYAHGIKSSKDNGKKSKK